MIETVIPILALILSTIAGIIGVVNFFASRKDKAVKDAKETNMELINYRLNELDKNVQKILDKLDTYDIEIDNRIDKAIRNHVEIYHKKG